MEIRVSSVQKANGVAIVHFTNGHRAVFVPNRGGCGEPIALQTFRLERNGAVVASFNSWHQHPVNSTPFGFAELALGYTVSTVAIYWRVARTYVLAAFINDCLVDAWHIITLGSRDLREVEQGMWPAPVRRTEQSTNN